MTVARARLGVAGRDMRVCLVVAFVVPAMLAAQMLFAPSASAGTAYVSKLHSHATGKFALHGPLGLAADNIGNVYVADTQAHRIVKFDRDGDPVSTFGQGSDATVGTNGHLYYPQEVVFANNKIYVADLGGHDIQVFTTGGTFVKKWGSEGTGNGQFGYANGITADCAGSIFVTDGAFGAQDVQKFDGDGDFITRFGRGRLDVPVGIVASYRAGTFCVNTDIFVADEYHGRLVRFSRGSLVFQHYIGEPGRGHKQFDHPDQIALSSPNESGNKLLLWVAESGTMRVQELSSDNGGGTWAFETAITHGAQPLNAPHGVATDHAGRVYIANTGESEIYKYKTAAPALSFGSIGERRSRVLRDEDLRFTLKYNQAGESCHVLVKATVTVPPHASHQFTVDNDAHVADTPKIVQLNMSSRQVTWIEKAWNDGNKVNVHAKAAATCEGGDVHLSKTVDYKL